MRCPKCGREALSGAALCRGCHLVFDTALSDIVDGASVTLVDSEEREPDYGGDAVILGGGGADYDSFIGERSGSFLNADTDESARIVSVSAVYIDKLTQELLEPDAVLGIRPGLDVVDLALAPIERFTLGLIDGNRPVERLRKKAGLSLEDLRIALTMLADKGVVVRVGTARPNTGELNLDDDEFSDEGESFEEARTLAVPRAISGIDDVLPPSPRTEPGPPPEVTPPARPAAVLKPALQPAAPPPKPPPPQQMPRMTPSPQPARSPAAPELTDAQRRAAEMFVLAKKDQEGGHLARGHMFAKMAVQLDPTNKKYQELLAAWHVPAQETRSSTNPQREDVRLLALAQKAEDVGDYTKAVELLKRAIALNPKGAPLHNRLGVILATRLKNYEAAYAAIMEAVELEPSSVVYKNNLGKVIAMSGSVPPTETAGILRRLTKRLR